MEGSILKSDHFLAENLKREFNSLQIKLRASYFLPPVYLIYLNAPKAGNPMIFTGCLISSSFIHPSLIISPLIQ